jgi:hypothetical protein
LGVYRVQELTNEKFIVNAVQVEMQRRHLYTARHAARAANVVIAYRAKHGIVHNDMV